MQQRKDLLMDLPDLELVFVEGGGFLMGSDGEFDREKPVHQVEVPSFYMAKYQVTQRLWEAVMGNNPSRFKGDRRPVEMVSWENAHQFIQQLNQKTRKHFRLPTEAEWEYAACGGCNSQGYVYAGSDKLKQVGWYNENSGDETHEVGLLLPNELGIYDMSGNVLEWCEDDYHGNYKDAPDDGSDWTYEPNRGAERVLRGGSYFFEASHCRATSRNTDWLDFHRINFGFRLVLPL